MASYNPQGGAPAPQNPSTNGTQTLQATRTPTYGLNLVSPDNGDVQGAYTQAPVYVDPYAQWGGQTAYNNLINQFNTQKQGVYGSANEAGDAFGAGYGRSITDWLENTRLGQQNIDTKAARNELAKMQGVRGIQGMVGRGIKSSGVMLGNKNAGDSSAAGAIANAYGDQGRRQMANVGNQYALGNEEIQSDQNAFDVQANQGMRALQGSKEDKINQIVLDARNQFSQLDAWAQDKSLPQRIAAEQEKEAIRQQLLQKLQGFDAQLTQGRQGIQASTIDQRREKAATLGRAGTDLGADAFSFSTETPMQFQGTGPFASDIPLFTLNKRRQQ